MFKARIVRWVIVLGVLTGISTYFFLVNKKLVASPDRDLRVLSATPQGTIQDASETGAIQVNFGSPMVPLGSSIVHTAPMKIRPKAAGQFRWIGTSTLVFEPSTPFPLGTRYQVTIPKKTGWSERRRQVYDP